MSEQKAQINWTTLWLVIYIHCKFIKLHLSESICGKFFDFDDIIYISNQVN